MAAEKLILIAENSDKYRSIAERDTELITLPDINDTISYLRNNTADIILIDTDSIKSYNNELCSMISMLTKTYFIPVIIISSDISIETISELFDAGCCDFIIKPFDDKELLCRIRYNIKAGKDNNKLISENKELNLFFAAVAHDLKSPVNSLIMLTDIIKDEATKLNNNTITETSEILSGKSAKVSAMIDSLMRFSRISSMIPEIEEINIGLLFEDIFNELHSREAERDIILEIDELPVIYGDDVLIEILIQNLLSNAFKFTADRQKAVIKVSYSCSEKYHIISVKDNGIGFDMKDSGKIFQIFKRLHGTEKYEGSGVGLAMCHRIMTRHGGRIEAKSSPDNGAEFVLFFPKQLE